MSDQFSALARSPGIELGHVHAPDELAACFPVMSVLRPGLKDVSEWMARASDMKCDGYRILAARHGGRVLAIAGYRVTENLCHGRFVYVDDLVTASDQRGRGLGGTLLRELTEIGVEECCQRLVVDSDATNIAARRFYINEGLTDATVGFVMLLENVS